MGAARYTPEQIAKLIQEVDKDVDIGESPTSVCTRLVNWWAEYTGRPPVVPTALVSLYNRSKLKKLEGTQLRKLAQDSVVMMMRKSDNFASSYPTLQEAVRNINGKVDDYRFFEAKELKVSFKTVMVIE